MGKTSSLGSDACFVAVTLRWECGRRDADIVCGGAACSLSAVVEAGCGNRGAGFTDGGVEVLNPKKTIKRQAANGRATAQSGRMRNQIAVDGCGASSTEMRARMRSASPESGPGSP